MGKQYKTVGLGGTFDHFHDGHKQFIEFAAHLSQQLIIGVTYPELTLHKPFAHLIESPEKRAKMVKQFCHYNNIPCEVVELVDIYGPTLEDKRIEALIVTEETLDGAKKINDLRLKMKLRDLNVHVAPLLKNQAGQPLHSEQIRGGEANRQGIIYRLLFEKNLVLNEEQRQFFSKPLGKIVDQPIYETASPVCVVGDASVETFVTNNWNWWDVAVFDGKQQRTEYNSESIGSLNIDKKINNSAGMISAELVRELYGSLTNRKELTTIFVNGEEDLATVALVLLLPLDSVIYYGQPNEGMVEVVVTEHLKDKVYQILL
jgi:pantetheine-phosphate adenylyltransferase